MPSLGNHVDAVFIPESVNTSTTLRINGGDLHLDDGKKALFGQGDDLQIYHDGSNSYIEDEGEGNLRILSNKTQIRNAANSQTLAEFTTADLSVTLYKDSNARLQTTTDGVTVTGTALATALSTGAAGTGINISTGTITGPATLTIDPAAIGDDTGLVIVKGDFQVDGTTTTINSTTLTIDDKNIVLASGAVDSAAADGAGVTVDGADATLLYKSTPDAWSFNKNVGIGTDSPGANLQITSDAPGILFQDANSGSTESKIEGLSGHLYYTTDNVNRDHIFAATGGSESLRITGDGIVRIPDNGKFTAGADDDLQIYHTGLVSYISDQGTGALRILATDVRIRNAADDEQIATFTQNGAVELYYDNSIKIETTTAGVTVTGALEVSAATNITVGGTALPSLTNLLGGSLDGTLGSVTMAYLPAAPSSPVQGQFYFNSLSSKAQIYTGSSFVDLVPSGGGGGGGGGGSSTDANATFRKYTYSISSTTSSVSGSSDLVTSAGSFVTGRKYTIKTVGTTDFTAIGASANTVGVVFDATGAGSGSGDAFDTLVYSTADNKNVEVYVNGVKAVEGATNDYVATSGTSVNFVANLASGDVVDIQVYELLTNDAFVLATGGTFSGNVGINTSTINNRLHIHSNANEQGILLTQEGNNYSVIYSDSNRTGASDHLLAIEGHWNGTPVAEIALSTGSDTTNKDDGQIIFRTSSADNLSTGERMRIDSSGNVGIGTDNPAYKLEVEGDIKVGESGTLWFSDTANSIEKIVNTGGTLNLFADSDIHFYESDNNVRKFTIDVNDGQLNLGSDLDTTTAEVHFDYHTNSWINGSNLGIGTTNPLTKLEVVGDITITNGTQNNVIRTNAAGQLQFLKNAATNNTVTVTIDDETGNVGIGTETPSSLLHLAANAPYITFEDKDNNQDWQIQATAWFALRNQTTSSELLRVTHTGQVGIGTNSIARGPLHIHQDTTGDTQIHMTNSETGTSSSDGFTIFTGASTGSHSGFVNREANARIRFLMHPSGGSDVTDQMVLLANGNLGLGISDPTDKLHMVGGKILLTGANLAGTNHSAIRSEATIDSVNREMVFNLRLQTTMTDNGTTSSDREQGGVYNLITNNATGGDTNHEQRVYGVWNDINNYGDPDQLYGTYNNIDSYHTSGTISSLYSSYNLIQVRAAGNVSNMYASYNLAQPTSGSTGTIAKIVGVRGRVNLAGTSAVSLTDQWGVWGNVDNDANVVATGVVACFYGSYDTVGDITTPYGIYMGTADLSHYLSGVLGVGNASNAKSYTSFGALHIGDETTAATTNDIVFGKRVTTAQSNLPRIGHCDILGTATNNDLGLNACSSGGAIGFFTGNGIGGYGDGSNALRMIIEVGGNVGIGTNNPGHKLDIYTGTYNRVYVGNYGDTIDGDRHRFGIYRQDTVGGTVYNNTPMFHVNHNGAVYSHSSVQSGRTRTDVDTPTNYYTHGAHSFDAYSGRTDSATEYRTRVFMRAWDGGDVSDRNFMYFVDSQSDTVTVDYDLHQRFGIKADGMTHAREDIWSGRCESDEATPNSVYTSANTNLIRSYATNGNAQTYMQACAVPTTSIYSFYVETGTSSADDNVAFRIRSTDGRLQTDASSTQLGGADYAEYFEWEDGNPSNEDRVGTSVVLGTGEKIRPATSSDDTSQIIGVISATPCVVGDAASLSYHDRYLKDDWGRDIMEDVEMLVWNIGQNEYQPKQSDTFALTKCDECIPVSDIDEALAAGRLKQWVVDQNLRRMDQRRKLNPDYDASKKDDYEPRENRKEWDAVGLVGKLYMKKGQPTGTNWIKLSDKTESIERWLVR